jgi:hypothetical protein
LTILTGHRSAPGTGPAYFKSLLDALVKAGLLVNDSGRWCELGPVTFDRRPPRQTAVILQDQAGQGRGRQPAHFGRRRSGEPASLR